MKYFFFSIFFIIVVGLIFFYINISKFNLSNSGNEFAIHKEKKEENSIIKALSLDKKNILLPAKELYLRIDLHNNQNSQKAIVLYRTLLDNLNEYTLFGVEQILKLNNIKYSIIKSKNDLKLFINFNRKSQADKIMKLFKKYNFDVKLKEIKIKE